MNDRELYPAFRNTVPVSIDAGTLRKALELIDSCEHCTPDLADIPFDYVLDSITSCDPEVTDYVLSEPVRCPRCGSVIEVGFWRWYDSPDNDRKAFILPGTLVTFNS